MHGSKIIIKAMLINPQAYETDKELGRTKTKKNKTMKQRKSSYYGETYRCSWLLFRKSHQWQRNLIKSRQTFSTTCRPEVRILMYLVKLKFIWSETCVDGKIKVFFFSNWSKIPTNSPFLKTGVVFSKILSNERCIFHLSQAISVVIHPEDSYELSLSLPRSALIFKHFFIKELFTLRNSSCVQTSKRAYFHARFSLLYILPW